MRTTLLFGIAVLAAVLVATLLPGAMAIGGSHPSGTKNLHCTFNMSFSGSGAVRKYWGKFQAWHDYDNPSVGYPMIQAEGKSIGLDRDGTSWSSPITLRAGAPNNFVRASPWFDDSGVDIHINNNNIDDYVYAVGPTGWQVDVSFAHTLWLNSDWVYVWCEDDDADVWNQHKDDWKRDGNDDDDKNENDNHSHAVGDPAFSGFLGQQYQVHGTIDTVHNIVSAPSMQVNALFVFLEQGLCPEYPGAPRTNCWSHPGTYFGRIGIKTASGERLFVEAGGAKVGFAVVMQNGKSMAVGDSVMAGDLNMTRTGTHTLIVGTPLMEIVMENSDMFINLIDVNVYDVAALRRQRAHGLLGQTWRRRSGGQVSVLEGMVDDYVEASNDIFGDDFVYNRFTVVSM